MSNSPSGIYEVGIIDPGQPSRESSIPFWLSEPSKIAKLQSPWLQHADVVIIGSGITSASLCRSLFRSRPQQQVVVIESRQLCSGATGRNGGHCKAMSPGVWFERKKQYGVEEATQITRFEHSHLDRIENCIKESSIECDFRRVEGLDVYHDTNTWQRAIAAVKDIAVYDPELATKYTVYSTEKDLRARGLGPKVVGAVGMPAGTLWPYKLVTTMFEQMAINYSLNVQTSTNVLSVSDHPRDNFATVHTDRGAVRATQVVHATNGWIGHLVDELRPMVSPVRANVQRQVPRGSVSRNELSRSYWLRYGEKEYDYLISRPDGAFIMGRANAGRRATANDGELDLIPQTHLRHVTPQIFDLGTQHLDLTHQWSGAVAFTADHSPFVGSLSFPGRDHQWVCGAYQGIGMVAAFRSAEALALLLIGEAIPEEFPKSWLLTSSRVKALQRSVTPKL